jgi:hypothetical protein
MLGDVQMLGEAQMPGENPMLVVYQMLDELHMPQHIADVWRVPDDRS